MEKAEDEMKKTIIFTVLTAIIVFCLGISVTADEGAISTPSVSSISISSYPDKTVYGAFERLDTSGLSLRAVFADGSERIIRDEEIRISYNRDNCFRVGDDRVLLSYGGKSVYLPVTVNRISYDLSSLKLDGFSVIYNSEYQSYNRPLPQIVGLDGIPLSINLSGGGIDVGLYDVSMNFHTESKDYITPESRVISMTVEPASAMVCWENTSFVYDGKSKAPSAYYIDAKGRRIDLAVSGAATNAGKDYVARASANDLNYEFDNTATEFEIKKADFDFSSVIWSRDSFIYDGSKRSIIASGLPSGVSIIGYSGDRATDAGVYTVTAMLGWDENNFNPPPTLSHIWEIKKADYDISGISFKSEVFTYDGKMHYPTLVGRMPVGADGIALEYSFSSGAAHVSDGKVSVVISFHTESKNYSIPSDQYSSVSISPRGIFIEWGETDLSYNGEEQLPTAFADECAIKLSGAGKNVGKYIATASSENRDYYIINDKREFSILKAENYWTVYPADSICYEGRDIVITGESRFGEIEISFFADRDASERIDAPTLCGCYYAVLSVKGTDNYSALTSGIIAFEIIEILPVSFTAEIIKKGIVAFDRLSAEDLYCSVINNDGSSERVNPSLVTVIYERGDAFKRGDKSVTLEYGDFLLTLTVEVGYAEYDLSGVRWTNTSHTYDGTPRFPVLEGLPDGISITSYLCDDMINAGRYKVGVSLDYDTENYLKPEIPYCDFIIEKQVIQPTKIESIYNGEGQTAISDSPLYSVASTDKYTDAGVYTVLIELCDSENYTFSDGSADKAYAIFEILPATLFVSVKDVRLRLFEELKRADYLITEGTLYGDDTITVTPYLKDGRVLVCSDNPNYRLEVSSGKLIRLPYPTVRGAVLILASLLLVLVMLLTVLGALRNRHRIISAIAMIKCRWHNRGYKAPMPRIEIEGESEIRDISIAESFDKEIESIDATVFSESDEEDSDTDEEISIIDFEIDAERADSLISDSLAKSLINREGEIIYTRGSEKEIINLGAISDAFSSGERVDVNSLKKRGLISPDTAYIKVLGGGSIDKPLMVYANDFSISAVKMIALTGGKVTKVVTFKERSKDEKE